MKTSRKSRYASRILLSLLIVILCVSPVVAAVNYDQAIMNLDENGNRVLTWRAPADSGEMDFSNRKKDDPTMSSVNLLPGELYDNYSRYTAQIPTYPEAGLWEYAIGGFDNGSLVEYTVEDKSSADFNFLFFGDVQEGYEEFGDLLQGAYKKFPGSVFSLFAGDMVDTGFSKSSWDGFMDEATKVFDRTPMMPTIGNHEVSVYSIQDRKPKIYLNTFALPLNGPDGYKEEFYSFDYKNLHVTVLNSNYMNPRETYLNASDDKLVTDWIRDDIKKANQKWNIVMMHHPAYPVAGDNTTEWIQERWLPIIEEAGVDIILCGHQHEFMRTKSMNGVVQIMGNSGTKHYPTSANPADYVAFEKGDTMGYHRINVSSSTLTVEAYDEIGNKFDTWSKSKEFTDVKTGSWYYDSVNHLSDLGFVKGKTPTIFDPLATISRAEFVQILFNMTPNASSSGIINENVKDIPSSIWYSEPMMWAFESEVIEGDQGYLRPLNKISRQEMTTILDRYNDKISKKALSPVGSVAKFADEAAIAPWAKASVDKMQAAGIISGVPANNTTVFNPKDSSQRAQAAEIISNFVKTD